MAPLRSLKLKVGDLVWLRNRPKEAWNIGIVLGRAKPDPSGVSNHADYQRYEVWMDSHVFRFTPKNLEVISES